MQTENKFPQVEQVISIGTKPLISHQYRQEQEKLHATGTYGTASIQYAPLVSDIIKRLQVRHLLDYGCGENVNLAKHLKVDHKVTYQAYDPAVPRFSTPAAPAEMVACVDVLEHIEPDLLDNVLDDLTRVAEVILFASIDTGPAMKALSDGRNAHLIQEPMSWWLPKFWARKFKLQTVQETGEHSFFLIAIAEPRLEFADGSKVL